MSDRHFSIPGDHGTLIVATHAIECGCGRAAFLLLNSNGRTSCLQCAPAPVQQLTLGELADCSCRSMMPTEQTPYVVEEDV
jgi:hypothetical protein